MCTGPHMNLLAARATDAFEGAREKVRSFLNARSANEIVFVRGTTEAINLVAKSYGDQFLHSGDEIILSHLEHHANIVPWQQLAQKKGLKLRVIPVDDDGQILMGGISKIIGAEYQTGFIYSCFKCIGNYNTCPTND